MDAMRDWLLWRSLLFAVIALPFIVAAVVTGFRDRRADGSNVDAGQDDGNASAPIAGPDAWCKEGGAGVKDCSVDARIPERRVA